MFFFSLLALSLLFVRKCHPKLLGGHSLKNVEKERGNIHTYCVYVDFEGSDHVLSALGDF